MDRSCFVIPTIIKHEYQCDNLESNKQLVLNFPSQLSASSVLKARHGDTLVIPALGKRSQGDQEFEVTLGYVASFRPAWATLRPCLKNNKRLK